MRRPEAESPSVADEIEVLAVLISRYEDEKHPIDPPDAIAAIRFRAEQAGLTRKDLEKALGSRARVSDVLAGRRELSKEMIRNLHTMFGIPLSSLFATRVGSRTVHRAVYARRRRRS